MSYGPLRTCTRTAMIHSLTKVINNKWYDLWIYIDLDPIKVLFGHKYCILLVHRTPNTSICGDIEADYQYMIEIWILIFGSMTYSKIRIAFT